MIKKPGMGIIRSIDGKDSCGKARMKENTGKFSMSMQGNVEINLEKMMI
jgi:hypothetical protein